MSHTPGPWEYARMRLTTKDKDRRCGFVVNECDDSKPLPLRICDLRVPSGVSGFSEGEANARLIAAAPDLLEALGECVTDEHAQCIVTNDVAYMIRRFKAINAIAREAIAKATGGAQ